MRKFTLIALLTAFAATSLAATVMAASKPKAAPGKCGEFMYFDGKSRACKDKRS